jgi:DNA repair exonuclease SbcCD ATPase subunit
MTCPACDAHLSSVYSAFQDERPCPECGLPHDAAVAVLKAAERGAGEDLQRRYTKAEQRAARAEREANALRNKLRAIESEVNRPVTKFDAGVWDDW